MARPARRVRPANLLAHFGRMCTRRLPRDPIVVLGNQKSGTSVIAHLLANFGGLTRAVDIPRTWWPTLGKLLTGETTLSSLARSNPKPFTADLIKEPNLTFFPVQLRHMYPEARFVFVVRDPRDNLRSLLDRLGLPGDLDCLDPHARDVPETWAHIFDGSLWGLRGRHYIDILAGRWAKAADIYLQDPGGYALIRFEDFVDDKMEAIIKLAKSLNVKQRNDIRPDLNIAYQPRGNRDVDPKIFFGTRNLARIFAICRDQMERLHYDIPDN